MSDLDLVLQSGQVVQAPDIYVRDINPDWNVNWVFIVQIFRTNVQFTDYRLKFVLDKWDVKLWAEKGGMTANQYKIVKDIVAHIYLPVGQQLGNQLQNWFVTHRDQERVAVEAGKQAKRDMLKMVESQQLQVVSQKKAVAAADNNDDFQDPMEEVESLQGRLFNNLQPAKRQSVVMRPTSTANSVPVMRTAQNPAPVIKSADKRRSVGSLNVSVNSTSVGSSPDAVTADVCHALEDFTAAWTDTSFSEVNAVVSALVNAVSRGRLSFIQSKTNKLLDVLGSGQVVPDFESTYPEAFEALSVLEAAVESMFDK